MALKGSANFGPRGSTALGFGGHAHRAFPAGKSVFVLGPKWRIHEYLHLNSIDVDLYDFVKPGEQIATLGKSGNAASTPAHVHYGIVTPIPYVWKAFDTAGICSPPRKFNWMLMFWLNPADHLPTE